MNPLPPQAYTNETLTKAYAWLQRQPNHIKELASSTDILVSLFLKAKLNGEAALDRPSIQNFKSELRNLAGMMGEFENPAASVPSSSPPNHAAASASWSPTPGSGSSQSFSLPSSPPLPGYAASPSPGPGFSPESSLHLDPRSLETVREARNLLNLSSDSEALRVLLQMGRASLARISK